MRRNTNCYGNMSKTFKKKIDKLVTTGSLSDLNPSFLILHGNAARKKWGAVDMYHDRGDSVETFKLQ